MSSNILEFRKPASSVIPSYEGRVLALNPEQRHSFCCAGFVLGPRRPMSVVTSEANKFEIHRAVQNGDLLDVTDNRDIKVNDRTLTAVAESDTGKKLYFGPWSKFKDLGLACVGDITPENAPNDDEIVMITSEDRDEQKRVDARLKEKTLVLPPGMDDPDKYALKV